MPPVEPTACPDAILLMEGGHKTLLSCVSVTEAEQTITDARSRDFDFVYFQSNNHIANGFAVDPRKVVAVVANYRAV